MAEFDKPLSNNDMTLLYLKNKLSSYAELWDPDKYYYPGTSIIQTSGSGKSRTVLALAQHGVFVVYCSLMSENSSGFPTRSAVADSLASDKPSNKEHQFTLYYALCLTYLYNFLLEKEKLGVEMKVQNLSQLAVEFIKSSNQWMEKVDSEMGLKLQANESNDHLRKLN
jgi:hypothetical protein